jgi:hypothetical protein
LRVAAEIAERGLLLHALDGFALAAAANRDDDGGPRLRTDDAVDGQVGRRLERTHRSVGLRPEDAVDHDGSAVLAEQALQGADGMFAIALADQGEGLDVGRCGHAASSGVSHTEDHDGRLIHTVRSGRVRPAVRQLRVCRVLGRRGG